LGLVKYLNRGPVVEILADAGYQGLGAQTSGRILIEVGDGSTFPATGHLATYAALAPATKKSGYSIWNDDSYTDGRTGTSIGATLHLQDPSR
ncbi:transposase, partial [Streptomyces sp. NPDC090112]|uniref:transposase n=1 Tax=Streptomyces sp. NPDC090112 TaxID=3365949 RepID=UPI00381A799E